MDNFKAKVNSLVSASHEYDCDYFTARGGGFYPHPVGDHQDPLLPNQVDHIMTCLPTLIEPFVLPCSSMEEFYFLHEEGYIEFECPSVKEEAVDLIEKFLLEAGISSDIVEAMQWELVDEQGVRVH